MISALLGLSSYAQTAEDFPCFKILNGGAVYQRVIESDATAEDVVHSLNLSGHYTNITASPDGKVVSCDALPRTLEYKSLGYGHMTVPMFIRDDDMAYHAVIEFREGRYRFTISGITFTPRSDTPLFKKGESYSFDIVALKKGAYKDSFFYGGAAYIIEWNLWTDFEFTKVEEDW